MAAEELLAAGHDALAAGRWSDAQVAFEAALADEESPEACFGLAAALWWSGENRASVAQCTRAYSLFRQRGDTPGAVECAVWLAITYKANFANFAAANGWVGRAERLLEPLELGPLHGWAWVARAYRLDDLDAAGELTERALAVARDARDVDLELVALSQLGLIGVGKGETTAGFALIDEAMAAALAGERVEPRHGRVHRVRHAQRLRAGQRPRTGRAVVPGRRRLRRHLWLPVPLRRVPAVLRQRPGGQRALGRRRAGAGRRPAHHRGRLPRAARQGPHQDGDPAGPPGAAGRCGATARRHERAGRGRRRGDAVGVGAAAGPRRLRRGQPRVWRSAPTTSPGTERSSPRPSTTSSTPTSPRATSISRAGRRTAWPSVVGSADALGWHLGRRRPAERPAGAGERAPVHGQGRQRRGGGVVRSGAGHLDPAGPAVRGGPGPVRAGSRPGADAARRRPSTRRAWHSPRSRTSERRSRPTAPPPSCGRWASRPGPAPRASAR